MKNKYFIYTALILILFVAGCKSNEIIKDDVNGVSGNFNDAKSDFNDLFLTSEYETKYSGDTSEGSVAIDLKLLEITDNKIVF